LAFFGDNAEYLLDELRKIDLPKTFSSLQDLIKSTNETVDNTNKYLMTFNKQIMEMMANLQGIAQNVKQLSERTKDNPSSILFSSPPSPLNLNKL
jgi:methyl-accepting chemotaxis protein